MKRKNPFFRSGRLSSFTLVELLVVMGIIAILASVLFAGATSAIRTAQRAKAANLANQIQTAALNYYGEYNVYPIPSTPPYSGTGDYGYGSATSALTDDKSSAASWKALLWGLCGNVNPYDNSSGTANQPAGFVTNSRGIAFLTMKTADVDSTGGPKNPLPYSSTHPYFNMTIDADYNGIMSNMPSAIIPTTGNAISAGIAVWANCNTSASSTNANFYIRTF